METLVVRGDSGSNIVPGRQALEHQNLRDEWGGKVPKISFSRVVFGGEAPNLDFQRPVWRRSSGIGNWRGAVGDKTPSETSF